LYREEVGKRGKGGRKKALRWEREKGKAKILDGKGESERHIEGQREKLFGKRRRRTEET